MVKTKATNENLGWTIFFFFCLFIISVGVGIYNDSRIDELEEGQWFEWDNLRPDPICYSEICFIDLEKNQIGGCTMREVDCELFKNKYGHDVLGGLDENGE